MISDGDGPIPDGGMFPFNWGCGYEPVRPEPPYCPHLCFETDDMDAVIRILQENHIEILDGPNEIPDSEQWIYFMDPDMNVLEYIVWMSREKSGGT